MRCFLVRCLLVILLTVGLALAVTEPSAAFPGGPGPAPFTDALTADAQPGGEQADPCSCMLTASCSVPSLIAGGGSTAVRGRPPHILPRGDRIPTGLPPDVPSPPPRPV
jgi:hypothetical protein